MHRCKNGGCWGYGRLLGPLLPANLFAVGSKQEEPARNSLQAQDGSGLTASEGYTVGPHHRHGCVRCACTCGGNATEAAKVEGPMHYRGQPHNHSLCSHSRFQGELLQWKDTRDVINREISTVVTQRLEMGVLVIT